MDEERRRCKHRENKKALSTSTKAVLESDEERKRSRLKENKMALSTSVNES